MSELPEIVPGDLTGSANRLLRYLNRSLAPPRGAKCCHCLYWSRYPDSKQDERWNQTGGECRRNAPGVQVAGSYNMGVWPVVFFNQWCGAFHRKRPDEIEAEEAAKVQQQDIPNGA